ncbi:hypothetical protein Sme01_29140 [Sphaerisporangium melleum]|uniref:Uncharacterized protein n=1 Tax=Sphaerisporangium melleum TaxID=321316 RepID=A0A917R2N1_9ACTN|nr:hypothetical protein GCM10007964_28910 [Sphaerisporangium melleum]GII70438.1 hypothetical protein Sme01_29140 [Sphaerisporangium melleum]
MTVEVSIWKKARNLPVPLAPLPTGASSGVSQYDFDGCRDDTYVQSSFVPGLESAAAAVPGAASSMVAIRASAVIAEGGAARRRDGSGKRNLIGILPVTIAPSGLASGDFRWPESCSRNAGNR